MAQIRCHDRKIETATRTAMQQVPEQPVRTDTVPHERRQRLLQIVRERSYSSGATVTLSSGMQSSFYFDMKPTIMDPEGAHLTAQEILDRVPGNTVFVGGLEMGAVPIVCALGMVAHMQGRLICPFFVRKQAKQHGARKRVEGLDDNARLQGQDVIVVEDVTTTGRSALSAIDPIRELGGVVTRVITVVDREQGAAECFGQAGIAFDSLYTASDFR